MQGDFCAVPFGEREYTHEKTRVDREQPFPLNSDYYHSWVAFVVSVSPTSVECCFGEGFRLVGGVYCRTISERRRAVK